MNDNSNNTSSTPIQELPTTFVGKGEVKGFTYTLVHRSDRAYLYHVATGCSEHYEVFKKKYRSNSTHYIHPTGKSIESWFKYPKTLKRAKDIFEKFNNENIND